ncbi:MAG: PrsW family intramembrane metalloprotease, partial [Lachnospiraceae bacterium]|nr:PrsW family intramembrane metalloprotease [Lachnospiraceae bacterium]
ISSGFNRATENVNQVLNNLTGYDGRNIISFKQLFSDVFKRHASRDTENLEVSGTFVTREKQLPWRRPYIFARVFFLLLITCLVMSGCYAIFGYTASRLLPGIIFTGALAMPATLMIFFWETNKPKNIGIFQILTVFFIGGAMSLFFTFILDSMFPSFYGGYGYGNSFFIALGTGIVEETAKVVVVYLIIRRSRNTWILNGLLIGACVGAGFAVFETMGYALDALSVGGIALARILFIRGVLSVGGHVIWTGIAGAALMIVQDTDVLDIHKIGKPEFFGLMAIPVTLHTLWDFVCSVVSNQGFQWLFLGLIVVVGWIVIIKLINSGLLEFSVGKRPRYSKQNQGYYSQQNNMQGRNNHNYNVRENNAPNFNNNGNNRRY